MISVQTDDRLVPGMYRIEYTPGRRATDISPNELASFLRQINETGGLVHRVVVPTQKFEEVHENVNHSNGD